MFTVLWNFFLAHWGDILIVLAGLFVAIEVYKYRKTPWVQNTIRYLVAKAEQEFGSKTGQIKLAAVSSWIYQRMPFILRMVFPKEDVTEFIEGAVKDLTRFLDQGGTLTGYAEEQMTQQLLTGVEDLQIYKSGSGAVDIDTDIDAEEPIEAKLDSVKGIENIPTCPIAEATPEQIKPEPEICTQEAPIQPQTGDGGPTIEPDTKLTDDSAGYEPDPRD